MKPTLEDLHDYVLELLPDAERRLIEAEVARSPQLAAELRAVRETLGLFGGAAATLPAVPRQNLGPAVVPGQSLDPAVVPRQDLGPGEAARTVPTSQLRARLLGALSTGERYSPFMRDLARTFDLSEARIRELCDQIDVPSAWEAGPLPGIAVMHFAGGPNAVASDTGFVRLPRGLEFPFHRHGGPEINYVLEGAVRDGDGTLYLPGEAIVMQRGTEHEFSIPSDADAMVAVVQDSFEFVPKPAGPSS